MLRCRVLQVFHSPERPDLTRRSRPWPPTPADPSTLGTIELLGTAVGTGWHAKRDPEWGATAAGKKYPMMPSGVAFTECTR